MARTSKFALARRKSSKAASVREIEMTIDNTRGFYRQKAEIHENLARKVCNGKFTTAKAPMLFKYLTDRAGRGMSTTVRAQANRNLTAEFTSLARSCQRGKEWACNDLGGRAGDILSKGTCKRIRGGSVVHRVRRRRR